MLAEIAAEPTLLTIMVSAVPIREFKSCSIISGNISASRARWENMASGGRANFFPVFVFAFPSVFMVFFLLYFFRILFFYTFLLCRYPAIINGYLKMISQSFSRCKPGKHGLRLFCTFAQPETVCPEALQKNAFPQTGKPYGEAFSFFQESF